MMQNNAFFKSLRCVNCEILTDIIIYVKNEYIVILNDSDALKFYEMMCLRKVFNS